MRDTERHYSILLVSAGDRFIGEVDALLNTESCRREIARSASEARRRLQENAYDVVIVNAPPGDESGSRLCMDAVRDSGTVAAIFAADEMAEELRAKAAARGVFVLRKPTSRSLIAQALSLMLCARERLRGVEERAVRAEDRLDELRAVNRAKWLLIDREGMSEAEAHRCVEKSAMDAGVTKRLAAQMILDRYAESGTVESTQRAVKK